MFLFVFFKFWYWYVFFIMDLLNNNFVLLSDKYEFFCVLSNSIATIISALNGGFMLEMERNIYYFKA